MKNNYLISLAAASLLLFSTAFGQINVGYVGMAYTNVGNGFYLGCIDSVFIQANTQSSSGLPGYSLGGYINPITGTYSFNNAFPVGSTLTIAPTKDVNAAQGVNMIDVLKIQRHILGVELLNSPYKMIAADVNNSRSITASDIVELRKLIIGSTSQFSNVNSHRFIQYDYTFPNPNNPFSPPAPEVVQVTNLSNTLPSFYAIKCGDVTGSACTLFTGATEQRSSEIITTNDQWLTEGEVYSVPLEVPQHLEGVQFTLNHPNLSFIADPALGLVAHSPAAGRTNVMAFQADFSTLTLQFRALADGWLSDALSLTDGLGIDAAEQTSDLILEFTASGACGPECFTSSDHLIASPNPFDAGAVISFQLDQSQPIILEVYDMHGRAIYQTSQKGTDGLNRVWLDGAHLPQAGVYTCVVRLQNGVLTNRMIRN